MSPPRLLLVAGESSGDAHAAPVLARLRARWPGLECFGLGGAALRREGLEPLAEAEVLNVVGLSEILGRLGRVWRLRRRLLAEVERRRPRVALLVDLPGFNLNLAAHLRRRGVRVVQYVAPQAWAWREGRVAKLRARVDRLCVIFPFEADYFARRGLAAEFVGHPLLERFAQAPPVAPAGAGARPVLALVPGSRPLEVARLLPALARAARLLQAEQPGLRVVLPLAPRIDAGHVRALLAEAGLEAELLHADASRALAGARLGLVASGTAVLEGALCGVPMVVVYRVSWLSRLLARWLVRVPTFAIVNLLAGRRVVPELLQGEVRPARIAAEARALWAEGPERSAALAGLAEVARGLGQQQPSARVAAAVAELLEE
ncbi:MAG TPA: lipid-A-disaccharide synthase [Myxococcota bacterium]|nr:lipid-A-disaccharide synthase [Myxococcota bacterium]HRY94817.1 lipid-A-disaccharide synthase [Myxococcota bacterium]HSA22297.1 lipid-A-disaccharide synthase [Myxococcota bacterium]